MKSNGHNNSAVPRHVDDEGLVAYLDGEIGLETREQVRQHLESCWNCRKRHAAVERSIENFLQLRHERLMPSDLPPAGPSLTLFQSRLAAHQSLTPAQTFFRKIPTVKSIFSRIISVVNIAEYSLRTQVLMARGIAVVAMVSVVAAFILFSGRLNTVTAAEVLRLASEAQAAELARTDQPVIHQRISVKSSRNAEPVSWEVWNDTVNSRVASNQPTYTAAVSKRGNKPTKSPTENIQTTTVSDLRSILRLNGLDEHRPLSADAYRAWSESIAEKTEIVERGDSSLTIQTAPGGAVALGRIVEAKFKLRSYDYHPAALFIKARSVDGEIQFEIAENDYEITSLRNIDPAIFADAVITKNLIPRPGQPASTTAEVPLNSPVSNTNTAAQSEVATAAEPTASLDTELETVKLLDSVGALSGDQITVTRTGGRVSVKGIVDSPQRKSEILAALTPVRNAQGLKIDIQTAAELTAKQKADSKGSSQVDTINADTLRADTTQQLPVENELKAYFSRRGIAADRMNAEIMSYANSVLDRSRSIRRNALALKQVAERFSAADLAKLDAAKQAEYRSLLRSKAAAITADVRNLSNQLSSAGLGSFQSVSGASSDAAAAAKQLFNLASSVDSQVSSSFTISSGGSAAVKSPQFWRNLAQIAAIAAELGR